MAQMFKTPKTPTIEAPTQMPTEDDEEIRRKKRRRIAEEKNRSGVDSTILTAGSRETMGG